MSERNLAKNTTFYTIALAAQKALSFVYFIILARSLGVVGQGRFTFALSFTSIFAIFLDLGLSQVLIRETAKDKDRAEKYLSNIIGFKLALALVIYLIIILAINILNYPTITKELVYISGLVMLIDSLASSVYGAIRGRQNLIYESVGTIGNQSIVLVLGGIFLLLKFNPVLVMSVYFLASLANLVWSSFNLKREFKIRVRASFDWPLIKMLLAWSLPFAVAGIFSRIFSSADIVLLSKMSGDHAVGIYSAAFKVAFALQFVALAFSASLYPAFSAYWAHSRENLAKLFTKSMFWLMFLAGPLVFGVIAVADPAIPVIFGSSYAASVLPLQILMASMLFVFLCFPIGAMLNACDKQTRHTINLGVTALVSVLFNLALIPLFSYSGSAVANLASYIVLFILGLIVVNKIIKYDWRFLLWSALKIFIACLVMLLVVCVVKTQFNFILAIIAGVLVYFIVAYVLGLYRFSSLRGLMKEFKPSKKSEELIPPEEVAL